MSDDLITVATFTTPAESDVARAALEAEGIHTSVEGEATLTWFWQLSNAAGGARLQVPNEDVEKARQILSAGTEHVVDRRVASSGGWKCPHCHNDVSVDMDICWSCGTSKDGDRDPNFVTESSRDNVASDPESTANGDGPLPAWFAFLMIVFPPFLLGYAILTLLFRRGKGEDSSSSDAGDSEIDRVEEESADNDELTAEEEKAEELISRAWRAAVFSIAFLPIILSAYAVWVLFQYSDLDAKARRRTRSRWRNTMIVNTTSFVLWCGVIALAFWPTPFISKDLWPIDMPTGEYVEEYPINPITPGN